MTRLNSMSSERLPRRTRVVVSFIAGIIRPVLNLLISKTWLQQHKFPRNTGFIICINHCTEIDPLLVAHMVYNSGHLPHFLAKQSLFTTPVVGQALAAAEQIPVDRDGVGAGKSLEVAEQVLGNNGAIVIYPEGTLTRDPDLWPMKGHTGAVRLALETGAPVIPVAHWGGQELFPRYAKMIYPFPRKRVTMLVGDPVDLSEFQGRDLSKADLTAASEKVMDAITELLAVLRQETPPEHRWDPRESARER